MCGIGVDRTFLLAKVGDWISDVSQIARAQAWWGGGRFTACGGLSGYIRITSVQFMLLFLYRCQGMECSEV